MTRIVGNASSQEIWRKFVEGDKEALATLYFQYFDVLLNFGMKYSANRFLVEDSIQNIFVDLLKKQPELVPVENIRFYLIKALRNQISYDQRKNKKLTVIAEPSEMDFRITYATENALISKDRDEIQAKFLKMVTETLTDRQKEALYLKFNCGFDYVEIAEIMQISVESARTIIYRTLKTIKKTFGNNKYSSVIFWVFKSVL
uniref:RNA polymerase sigma factor n=1 Tax=uncultured Draconibacterium sp. TaxID=1573823 RepID=UPI0032163938